MSAGPPRRSWGAGRVVFLARLDAIRAGLRQGHSLTAIFARHQAALGIGYPSFCKLVSRYAADAKPTTSRARERPSPPSQPVSASPAAAAPPLPSSTARGSSDAGHQPARGGFNHDPLEGPDDRRRLLGED